MIWLDKDMTWLAPHDGRPGRPVVFSDVAIQFCLMIKVLFKRPLRQTTGMVVSLLKMADLDWTVPDYFDLVSAAENTGRPDWSCHACVPVSQLIQAAFRSKAKGLLPPNDE
ncbi:MAG: hypothetical protein ACI9IV_002289 [Paracoccaceae bacterium]